MLKIDTIIAIAMLLGIALFGGWYGDYYENARNRNLSKSTQVEAESTQLRRQTYAENEEPIQAVREDFKNFAKAISQCEGYGLPNSLPSRMNNPGAIKKDGLFVQYDTVEEGWGSLYDVIRAYNGVTLRHVGELYAPTIDNNKDGWCAKCVAEKAGIDTN